MRGGKTNLLVEWWKLSSLMRGGNGGERWTEFDNNEKKWINKSLA